MRRKVCLLGATAVGKTSLVRRFVHATFREEYLTTIGVKVDTKSVRVAGREVGLALWDLNGEDDFQLVRDDYLRGASGFLVVVDPTRGETLERARVLAARAADVAGASPAVWILNKADLADQWEIDRAAARAAGAPDPLETSARTGAGVERAFQRLGELLLEEA